MPTGDLKTNFADKRFLPQQRIKDTWFDYHSDQLTSITSRVWAQRRGVFGSATITGATDAFNITVAPLEFLDGDGNILILGTSEATAVPFENAAVTDYHIAVRHVEVPSGVVTNPATTLSTTTRGRTGSERPTTLTPCPRARASSPSSWTRCSRAATATPDV